MKRTLGLYIDETKIKAALLAQEKNYLLVEQLDEFDLYDVLERSEKGETGDFTEAMEEGGKNPFGVDLSEEDSANIESEEGHTNVDVILDVMTRMCPKGTTVAFNLADTNVYNKVFQSIRDKRPQKAKQEMWSRLIEEEEELDITIENIEYLERSDGSFLTFVHDDPLILAGLLTDSLRSISRQIPKIKLIDTIELVLANELVQSMPPEDLENTCVIFFSTTFIKIFFMQNSEISLILSTIHEGVDIQTASETAYSKLLFSIDSGQVEQVSTVVLCGEVDQHNAYQYFAEAFDDLNIRTWEPQREHIPADMHLRKGTVPSYIMPIALAAKAMEANPYPLYNKNFIPAVIRDKQAVYKISMPGFILLGVLGVSVSFFTFKSMQKTAQLRTERARMDMLDSQLELLKNTATEVDSLQREIAQMEEGTAIIDSLTKTTVEWAPVLEALSSAYQNIGPFSIERFSNSGAGELTLELDLTERQQVVQLERFIRNSMIYRVIRENPNMSYYNVQLQCAVKPGTEQEYRNELRD